jgi:thiol-disulfide isomerase/thioredoxin
MPFNTCFGRARAIFLGLAIGASPALAQQPTLKAKNNKVKPTAPDSRMSKGKAVAAPQPVSPVASAPQTVLPAAPAPAQGLESAAGWVSDLGAAQARAKATGRPILAVFSGSDWCKPCVVYEQEVFARPEFTAYAKDKLVLAHFDFPRLKPNQPSAAQLKLNQAAAAQLNREGDFPLAVVVSPEGKVLAKTGYIAGGPAAFEAYLKTVVPTL